MTPDWPYSFTPESLAQKQMFHGARTDFDTFKKEFIRPDDYDAPFNGFWFSSDRETSPAMVNPRVVMEVRLSMKNPASPPAWRAAAREAFDRFDEFSAKGARGTGDATRMLLQEQGYDGVVWSDVPSIDKEALKREGKVSFKTVRGAAYELRSEDGGIDLWRGGELITGYADLADFLSQQETVIVVFEPEQIEIVSKHKGWGCSREASEDLSVLRAPLAPPATGELAVDKRSIESAGVEV